MWTSTRRNALLGIVRSLLLTCSPRTFILKAINQAVSRLYVHENTEDDAA